MWESAAWGWDAAHLWTKWSPSRERNVFPTSSNLTSSFRPSLLLVFISDFLCVQWPEVSESNNKYFRQYLCTFVFQSHSKTLRNKWVWEKISCCLCSVSFRPLGQWLKVCPHQCIGNEYVGPAHFGFMLCTNTGLCTFFLKVWPQQDWWVTVSLWCYYNSTSEITYQRIDFFFL